MGEFLRDKLVVGLQNADKDLRSIANLNVTQQPSVTQLDADSVVKAVEAFSSPTSVVDLALQLKWDADRLAQALTFASERGRLAFSRIKDQTFVGLPTNVDPPV